MPERLRLSGIWFLFFNLYRLPIPGDILLFLRCHRFAPGVSATAHPSRCAVLCSLVMEQSDSGKYHRHVILITAFDDRIIPDGAAGLCKCILRRSYVRVQCYRKTGRMRQSQGLHRSAGLTMHAFLLS